MTKTYNEIYIQTRRALKEAGIENYAVEARLLVSEAAGKTQAALMRDLTLYSADGLDKKVEQWVARRLAGEPVAYIAGAWEFDGVRVTVTPDVLIPRSDTEVLSRAAEQLFKNRNTHPRILDLCCGSGCIGIALALHMPAARVILVDNDPKALAVARENMQRYELPPRAMCVEADATKKPPMLLGSFDLIVANAPYVPTAEIETLDPSVKDYEPYHALDGGEDGLDIVRCIIRHWKTVLREHGSMMLEIGEGQSETVQQLLREAGFAETLALKDPGGCERVVIGRL